MKRVWKYMLSALFCLSVGVGFLPLIKLSAARLSVADIIKLGVGADKNNQWMGLSAVVFEYVKPYLILLLLLIAVILLSAWLCVTLSTEKAYIAALIGTVAANVIAVGSIWSIYAKTKELKNGLDFFGLSNNIALLKTPVFAWLFIYVAICGISILGIIQSSRPPKVEGEDKSFKETFTESFNQSGRLWDKNPELYRKVTEKPKVKKADIDMSSNFKGAVRGGSGIYKNKVYMLEERIPVYFIWTGQSYYVSEHGGGNVLAQVYYVGTYQEYCFTPVKARTCYLRSGQPLGKDRHYFLPRGTRIYINGKSVWFQLA